MRGSYRKTLEDQREMLTLRTEAFYYLWRIGSSHSGGYEE
jgi:hypothetical protein